MNRAISDVLAPVARASRLLIALDFDGTLSPLVDEPMSARALPDAARALSALSKLPDTTVALVSGRSLVDLRIIAEHDDSSSLVLVGSHGAERWLPAPLRAADAETRGAEEQGESDEHRAIKDRARESLPGVPGVFFEPKSHGFAVHVRLANPEDGRAATEAIDALMQQHAPSWRRRAGHNVVEYSYRHEGKDTAIAFLRELVDADVVLFAGDDVTDEDAMRALHPGDLGIRVGEGESVASLRVADPQELSELLWTVANIRGRQEQ